MTILHCFERFLFTQIGTRRHELVHPCGVLSLFNWYYIYQSNSRFFFIQQMLNWFRHFDIFVQWKCLMMIQNIVSRFVSLLFWKWNFNYSWYVFDLKTYLKVNLLPEKKKKIQPCKGPSCFLQNFSFIHDFTISMAFLNFTDYGSNVMGVGK
jgi:hypothetical protein